MVLDRETRAWIKNSFFSFSILLMISLCRLRITYSLGTDTLFPIYHWDRWWPRCSVCIDNFRYSLYSQSRIYIQMSRNLWQFEITWQFWVVKSVLNQPSKNGFIYKRSFPLPYFLYPPQSYEEKVVSVKLVGNRIENWLYGQNFYVWFIQWFDSIII